MKVKDFFKGIVVGRHGNVIYYERNGELCVRRYAIPGKKRKRDTEGPTPKQREAMARFAAVQRFYREYAKQVSADAWKLAGVAREMSAVNLFHSLNCACFNGQGEMVDFEKFCFSEGGGDLPREIKVEREGNRCVVTWSEERDWSSAARTDVMRVGVLYDDRVRSPRLALDVTGCRGDSRGEFTLDESIGRSAHVYIFFERADHGAFSPSQYARVIPITF